MVDKTIQKMGGYELVLEWTVLGARTLVEGIGRNRDSTVLEYGDVMAIRIDPPADPVGTFTANLKGKEFLESSGQPVRVVFTPPLRYDPTRQREGKVAAVEWACSHGV